MKKWFVPFVSIFVFIFIGCSENESEEVGKLTRVDVLK